LCMVAISTRSATFVNIDSMFMDRLMPNKTQVLSTLSSNGKIEKWARVVTVQQKNWDSKLGGISEWMVSNRGLLSKYITMLIFLKVGPLPVGTKSLMKPLSYIYNAERNYVKRPVPNIVGVIMWLSDVVNEKLKDMITDLLGEVSTQV
jgi:hypothetical protein